MNTTYKQLASYDSLIDKGDGKGSVKFRNGNINDDISVIEDACSKYHWQVKDLAAHLKDPNELQSAFNVHHFIQNNIKYHIDPPGIQTIRTPAGIWRERKRGVDCKGMSIMAWSLMKEMGYNPDLITVAFSNHPEFSHIFCRVDGYIIDAVPTMKFNKYAPHITKRMRISEINGLEEEEGVGMVAHHHRHRHRHHRHWWRNPHTVLNPTQLHDFHAMLVNKKRLGERALKAHAQGAAAFFAHHEKHAIHGIGSISLPDKVTEMLMDRQSVLLSGKSGLSPEKAKKEVKKTRYLIMLNGMPERNIVLHLMTYVDHIDSHGKFVFHKGADLETLEDHIGDLEDDYGIGEDEEEGLGRKSKEERHAAKEAKKEGKKADKEEKKHKTKAQKKEDRKERHREAKAEDKENNKHRSKAGRVFHKLSKYNPAEVVMRNSVLAILGVNLFGISEKLKMGYYTEEQARAKGFNIAEFHELQKGVKEVEKIWDKLGGSKAKFRNTIIRGGHGLRGPEVAAATASPFITKVLAILKKVNFKKLLGTAKDVSSLKKPKTRKVKENTIAPTATDADSTDSGTSTALPTPVNVEDKGDSAYNDTLKNKAQDGTPQNAGYNSDADASAADKAIPDSKTPASADTDKTDNADKTDAADDKDKPKSSGGSAVPYLVGAGVAAKLLFF